MGAVYEDRSELQQSLLCFQTIATISPIQPDIIETDEKKSMYQ
jgi:hypothetical protein